MHLHQMSLSIVTSLKSIFQNSKIASEVQGGDVCLSCKSLACDMDSTAEPHATTRSSLDMQQVQKNIQKNTEQKEH